MSADTTAPTSLTLCATELQARLLRAEHQRTQRAQGKRAWESPEILSLGRWVRQSWLQSWPAQELISRSKERWLWQELIRQHPCHTQLLAPHMLAEQFMRVWRLCQHWQIQPADEPRWTREHELFAQLHQRYQQELDARNWITDAELPGVVLEQLRTATWECPPTVTAWGFPTTGLSPVDSALLQELEASAAGNRVEPDAAPSALCYPTPSDQWAGVAKQLQSTLENDADARIVVAVPSLAQHADAIDVQWTPMLAPELLHAGASAVRPWAIELPRPLLHYPAIGALLDLCKLAPAAMDFITVSAVLRQPALFTAEDALQTAQAERQLRESGLRFHPEDLVSALPATARTELRTQLQSLAAIITQEPRSASGENWVQHWQARWQALPLTEANAHWALHEDLQQALASFVSLADEMGVLNREGALNVLRQTLQDHMHSERQSHDLRILVCDSSQAAGLPCTHLFVTHLDARHHPSPRPPLPWLNAELLLQKEHPQASPHHWLAQQRQELTRLCQQEQTVALCFAAQDDSGTPQTATPLLKRDWQTAPPTDAPERPADALIWPASDTVPALSPERLARQKGGSTLLRRQSASPFGAFVYHRLNSRELPAVPSGLSPARQGEWVHAVLAQFWEDVQSSQGLAELADAALVDTLLPLIAATQNRFLPAHRYGSALQALEADRVLRLCSRWLQHERKRTDPFVVVRCEAPFHDERLGLSLKLRVDRVDRVETAYGPRYLVIDYKTGAASMQGWRGEILQEPQLPLYATSPAQDALQLPSIDGICFARVHEHQPALLAATNWCRKLSIESPHDKEWKYVWDDELAAWERQLNELIRSFADGEIRHRMQTDLSRDLSLRAVDFLLDPTPLERQADDA